MRRETTVMMPQRNIHTEQGFTIIEIMVAITLSLILLYGVTNIFLGSRTSYKLQTGMARMQENARFALDSLARSVGMAGAQRTIAFDTANTQEAATADATLGFTAANGQASDTISVNYTATQDCLGNPLAAPPGGPTTASFTIARDPVTNISNLYCNGQPLAEGIQNMQILYGVDTDTDGVANIYVSANNVPNWSEIATVRIAILASTVDDTDVTNTNVYRLLNTPPIGPFNDEQGRKVYSRTIMVRNYIP